MKIQLFESLSINYLIKNNGSEFKNNFCERMKIIFLERSTIFSEPLFNNAVNSFFKKLEQATSLNR